MFSSHSNRQKIFYKNIEFTFNLFPVFIYYNLEQKNIIKMLNIKLICKINLTLFSAKALTFYLFYISFKSLPF